MQLEEMMGLIQQGEGQTVEFKASFAGTRDAIESLCAFTHADGGTVFFGVRDDGTVCGVSLGKKTLEDFANQVKTNTQPWLAPRIYKCTIEGKDVIGATVDKLPADRVCFAYSIAYVRVGKTNQVMHPDQIRARLLAGSQPMVYSGQAKEFVEAVPKVTARVLVDAGLKPAKVHLILKAQDKASQQKNDRLAKFLDNYVEKELYSVPPVWHALIAGFPIIGQDIGSQSLNELAELVKELHPYLSKELRGEYHKKVQPILIGILAELQAFLDDAARAGGLPLTVMDAPPLTWKDWLPWRLYRGGSWKVNESLVRGCWSYLIPKEIIDLKIEIERTWAGFLYDIISRLPDPDRQKGKLLRKSDLLNLIYVWCSTAPEDFKPSLTKIVRKPVNISDHTFAGVYKYWKESFGKSPD
ncbi:MAG: ATP-binding protein [Candidatus Omnitrophica bacterium]|nr:ATP-binding protein [Candidatus Omnitrophota bacterium]